MAGKSNSYWRTFGPLLTDLVQQYRSPLLGVVDWERVRDGLPLREDGSRLTTDAVRMQYKKLVRDGRATTPAVGYGPPILTLPPAPPPPDPIEVERERQDRVRKLREERDLLTAVAGEQALRAKLERVFRDIAPQVDPPPPYRAPKGREDTVEETLVLHLSDWHSYEIVDAERTRGFGEYNAKIFGQRVRQIVEAHRSIKRRMERGGGWRFPRLVVALNGDLVSGTIHEVERHSDAPNIVLAVFGCAHVLAAALRDLAAEHEAVEVFCTSGNHGRLPDARRMQQKDPTRSWDTAIALYAREMLRGVPRVTFYIPNSYSVAYDVMGWRFLQTHGHDVKSWNQIPHYGINRMVGNLNALEASRGKPINYFLFGHFHNKTSLEHASGEWFINGSLVGGTEFSLAALGKSDKPCQWLLAVHPEHGVSHRWPLSGLAPGDAAGYPVRPWDAAA
jgi:hypothetical protein